MVAYSNPSVLFSFFSSQNFNVFVAVFPCWAKSLIWLESGPPRAETDSVAASGRHRQRPAPRTNQVGAPGPRDEAVEPVGTYTQACLAWLEARPAGSAAAGQPETPAQKLRAPAAPTDHGTMTHDPPTSGLRARPAVPLAACAWSNSWHGTGREPRQAAAKPQRAPRLRWTGPRGRGGGHACLVLARPCRRVRRRPSPSHPIDDCALN